MMVASVAAVATMRCGGSPQKQPPRLQQVPGRFEKRSAAPIAEPDNGGEVCKTSIVGS